MISYLTNLSLTWIVLLLIYKLFLEKEKFFVLNRFYLLFSLLLGLTLPLLSFIDIPSSSAIVEVVPMINEAYHTQLAELETWTNETTVITPIAEVGAWFSWISLLYIIYSLGFIIVLFKTLRNSFFLISILRKAEVSRFPTHKEIITQNTLPPFSFFSYVFIGGDTYTDEEKQHILQHELHHIQSFHSYDILLIEMLKVVFWWNPFIYLYRRAITENHEYSADAAALEEVSRKRYCAMLMQSGFSGVNLELTNPFFQSFIKKRIIMMYQMQSKKTNTLKYGISVFAIFILGALFLSPAITQDKTWTKVAKVIDLSVDSTTPISDDVTVSQNGEVLNEGIDYSLNKKSGKLTLSSSVNTHQPVQVNFEENPINKKLEEGAQSLFGLEKHNSKKLKMIKNLEDEYQNSKCKNNNGIYYLVDQDAHLLNMPEGEDPIDYSYSSLSKFAKNNFVLPDEAIIEGFFGYVFVHVIIDENGKIERYRESANRPLVFGVDKEVKRLVENMKEKFIFAPAKCNGENVRSQVPLSINTVLPEGKLDMVQIRNPQTVVPNQSISIHHIAKREDKGSMSFNYRSNMNIPTTITVTNPDGVVIFEQSFERMYKQFHKGFKFDKKLNGDYKIVASQGGSVVSSIAPCRVFK